MEASVKLVMVFFGIATGFLEHFRAGGGGSVAIPGIHCTYGLLWILWVVCTSATVCGMFGCWGDIVTR